MTGTGVYLLAAAINGTEITWEGALTALAMGAATATIVVVGGKLTGAVKNYRQEKREVMRRVDGLPGPDNDRWNITDGNGNILTKTQVKAMGGSGAFLELKGTNIKLPVNKGWVDFSSIAIDGVTLDGPYSALRKINFPQFNEKLAVQWRANPDLIPDDYKAYFAERRISLNNLNQTNIKSLMDSKDLTWHECADMRSAQLVESANHTPGFGGKGLGGPVHYGGVQEVARLQAQMQLRQVEGQQIFDMLLTLRGVTIYGN